METLLPDLAWIGGEFRRGRALDLGADGTIAGVRPALSGEAGLRLSGKALLPGFVDAHSHAFQRAIRGRTQHVGVGGPADFWTWREEMHAVAARLGPEEVEAVARMAFVDLALAGVTAVGEFHYLHHGPDGARYAQPDELALRVVAAAGAAGITAVLLRTSYARAGPGRPPGPRQLRFIDRSPEEGMAAVERLAGRGVRVGVAAHSLRALPLDWVRALSGFARARGLPFHVHAAEQPRELEDCVAEHGATPVALLAREGLLDPRTTLVHAVHLDAAEVAAIGAARATVCACPTTERDLGDGVVPAAALLAAGASLALGTDSHVLASPLENARELEQHLRLVTGRRAVLAEEGGPDDVAGRLLHAATAAGARSLGLAAGELRAGAAADLIAIDLDDPSVCGARDEDLAATVVFSAARSAVSDVWVGGRRIVAARRHEALDVARRDFVRAMGRLFG